jgi:hypothetical protein
MSLAPLCLHGEGARFGEHARDGGKGLPLAQELAKSPRQGARRRQAAQGSVDAGQLLLFLQSLDPQPVGGGVARGRPPARPRTRQVRREVGCEALDGGRVHAGIPYPKCRMRLSPFGRDGGVAPGLSEQAQI